MDDIVDEEIPVPIPNVVYLTFSKSHGIMPGLVKHGFIDIDFFMDQEIIPDCVHAYIHQKYIKYKTSEGKEYEMELEHWGLSWNLYNMCKSMNEIHGPFCVHMTIDVHFGEYE